MKTETEIKKQLEELDKKHNVKGDTIHRKYAIIDGWKGALRWVLGIDNEDE